MSTWVMGVGEAESIGLLTAARSAAVRRGRQPGLAPGDKVFLFADGVKRLVGHVEIEAVELGSPAALATKYAGSAGRSRVELFEYLNGSTPCAIRTVSPHRCEPTPLPPDADLMFDLGARRLVLVDAQAADGRHVGIVDQLADACERCEKTPVIS